MWRAQCEERTGSVPDRHVGARPREESVPAYQVTGRAVRPRNTQPSQVGVPGLEQAPGSGCARTGGGARGRLWRFLRPTVRRTCALRCRMRGGRVRSAHIETVRIRKSGRVPVCAGEQEADVGARGEQCAVEPASTLTSRGTIPMGDCQRAASSNTSPQGASPASTVARCSGRAGAPTQVGDHVLRFVHSTEIVRWGVRAHRTLAH